MYNNTHNLALQKEIEQLIRERQYSTKLTLLLLHYFRTRLNPAPKSRFAEAFPLNIHNVINMLDELDTFKANKIKSVEVSIAKQYYKFFEIEDDPLKQSVVSNTYTQEDIDNIKRRMDKLNDKAF